MKSKQRKLKEIEASFDDKKLPGFSWTPSSQSDLGVAQIWYDDGDLAVEVHGNLILDTDENKLAKIITEVLNEQIDEDDRIPRLSSADRERFLFEIGGYLEQFPKDFVKTNLDKVMKYWFETSGNWADVDKEDNQDLEELISIVQRLILSF
jgi:hypothetical protein